MSSNTNKTDQTINTSAVQNRVIKYRGLLSVVLLTAGLAGGYVPAMAQTSSTITSTQEYTMNNIDIAKTYIKAVQFGDQATLGSIISPDVVWHQPGDNQFSGIHRGMAAVGPMLGKMMEVSKGTFAITRADHYMANGDWVAITVEFAGEANDIKLKQPGVDLIRIEGGKIVEVWLYSSNQAQEDAFWGQ
ncbi:nuclear transport factor 2 family protein [Marinomonas mediterranea]|uniref:nuclear transport factor 2 family protein n=1 Tax=Marinomonas mediterranea TaxID=119864 RepID=UPI00234A77F0|nr:nuclear transport factor 2 family protein [Marinomonas mediterranea]